MVGIVVTTVDNEKKGYQLGIHDDGTHYGGVSN